MGFSERECEIAWKLLTKVNGRYIKLVEKVID